MYTNILVAIEHSRSDAAILGHIETLAKMTGAHLLLVHVADGFAARHFKDLDLRESEEIRDDRVYLAQCCETLRAAGVPCEMKLAMGDPATELIRIAGEERVDLIAMSTHGHRFFKDVIHGTTVDKVRHTVRIPVLLLRGEH
jgi:nucleotide-binding universal stress UspA family protein